jgi:hypothetical protein
MSATPASSAPSTAFDPSVPVPEEYDVFCHRCGYSLVGLAGAKCPECGKPFSPGELPYARVAWLHRRRLGFWRAYARTVRHVVFTPAAFAAELARPVRISADDARRFRRLTTYVAATAVFVLVLAYHWLNGNIDRWWQQRSDDLLTFLLLVLGGWLASVVFLRLATDMPLFIWEGLPSLPPTELAPLHHYAAAPLALTPLVLLVAVPLPLFVDWAQLPSEWVYTARGIAVLSIGAWVYLLWHTPVALMKGATACGNRRVAILAAYLPFHAALMAALVAMSGALVAMVVGYLWEQLLPLIRWSLQWL